MRLPAAAWMKQQRLSVYVERERDVELTVCSKGLEPVETLTRLQYASRIPRTPLIGPKRYRIGRRRYCKPVYCNYYLRGPER